ncbi:MAG: hypothetical protein EXS36_06410 [Pedosphaera sp.]|nr:hypothetical protein [Pedosphaera sp.]
MNKLLNLAQLVCALSAALATTASAASIGANFMGRNPPTGLAPDEVAGVVEQAFWNNINDSTFPTPEKGTTDSLADDKGKLTAVTVTFNANDSWESDLTPLATSNDRLTFGCIKQQGAGTAATFSVNNLAAGSYDLYVYLNSNNDSVAGDYAVGAKTFRVFGEHQFSGSFIQGTSTTDATREVCNYIKFAGVSPVDGKINLKATYISGGDGLGIAALQVVGASFPADLTVVKITIDPQPKDATVFEGLSATFTVGAVANKEPTGTRAVSYQWQRNQKDLAGETGTKLVVNDTTIAGDNGTKYRCVVKAPGAPTVNSTEVTLNVVKDSIPPVVVSVGGVSKKGAGIEVGVIFNEPIIVPAALELTRYKLSAGTVTAARYVTNSSGLDKLDKGSERGVVLTTTGLAPGSSYTLTVTGISDVGGNVSGAVTTPFTVSKMTWVDLARASDLVQDVVATSDNGFNVVNGGAAFWGAHDDATFVYEEITGDFDKVARVEGQDASSNWARAGLTARESLDSQDELASRYQNVHANPYPKKFDGTDSNQGFETNRRLETGGSTSSSNGDNGVNHPRYPNAWLRLRRSGDVIFMYRSHDGVTWTSMGRTDFNPEGSSALSAKMFVGVVFGSENGNIADEALRKSWIARFRDYGDFKNTEVAGKQTYSIGINFTDDTRDGSVSRTDVAGTDATAQANWNNAYGKATPDAGPLVLIGDEGGVAKTTTATVEWSGSGNTWASTGRGEENNLLTGPDHLLMTGFLDTSADSTTKIEIKGLGAKLTAGKYDVVVYALGGVADGRGGAYRVTDANGVVLKGNVLTLSAKNPTTLTRVPVGAVFKPGDPSTYGTGSYIVFTGLSSPSIIVEGTTQNVEPGNTGTPDLGVGDTQRAPINAVQLVAPSGLFETVAVKPAISIQGLTITFTGKLLQAATVNGAYGEVSGAKSPFLIDPAGAVQKYYRAGN